MANKVIANKAKNKSKYKSLFNLVSLIPSISTRINTNYPHKGHNRMEQEILPECEKNVFNLTWSQQKVAHILEVAFCLGRDAFDNDEYERMDFSRKIMRIADDRDIPYAAIDPLLQSLYEEESVDGASVMDITKKMF